MGIWESARSTVSKVTGTSAKVRVDWEGDVVTPGQSVPVTVVVDNDTAPLEIREVLLELRAVEQINAPRDADTSSILLDAFVEAADSTARSNQKYPPPRRPPISNYRKTSCTFRQVIRVGQATSLEPNKSRQYEGRITFPRNVEPSFSGKYCQHRWELRGRVDVFGRDPSSRWTTFRVCVPV